MAVRETPEERDRRLAFEAECARIGRVIAKACRPGVGFALMLFHFGEGGFFAYFSNAQRADMVKAVREWLEREEGRS